MTATEISRSKAHEEAILNRRNARGLNRLAQGLFALFGLFVVYILIKGFIQSPGIFLQQVLNGLQLGFIYALIALGYTMVYGIVKLINFAHGDVFMVGAFVSYYAINRLNLNLWPLMVWPGMPESLGTLIGAITIILVSMTVSGSLAVTNERFAYRPLRNRPRIAALITAIGVSFFLEYFGGLPFVFTNNYITYPRPFEIVVYRAGTISPLAIWAMWALFILALTARATLTVLGKKGNLSAQAWKDHPLIRFGMLFGGFMAVVLTLTNLHVEVEGKVWDLTTSNIMLVIMGSSIILQVVLDYIVRQTRLGKAMRATAYDKPASRLMGINVDNVITATFALGGALAGAAGVLYATAFKQVYYLMGIIPGLKAFVSAVIGGIGSIPGAFVGALIMGQAEVMSAAYISTPMRDAVSFSLLILVLLIWPQGIFGEPPGEKV